MLTPEQQRQVDVECAREAEWWGQLPDATKALNRYPVSLLLRDQVRELEAEVARLKAEVTELTDSVEFYGNESDSYCARVVKLLAEVARLRPVVEAAAAYRPHLGNPDECEVDTSAVGYPRWRLMADFVKAIDLYRATEAAT